MQQAAKELNVTPLTIRGCMMDGTMPIGYVIGKGKHRKTFIIYKEAVEKEKQRLGEKKDGIKENYDCRSHHE